MLKFPPLECHVPQSAALYRIDAGRALVVAEFAGRVEFGDIRSIMRAMTDDPAWSGDYNILMDFSRASLDLSANDVLRLALAWKCELPQAAGWTAFVVGSSVAYGVVRMLGAWARLSERMCVFPPGDEAGEWLEDKARSRRCRAAEAMLRLARAG